MYKIVKKRRLSVNTVLLDINAARAAKYSKPGQFVVVRLDEFSERIPLTICDYDAKREIVTIVIQDIGLSSHKICSLDEGDSLTDFIGPLGQPSEFIYEDIAELRKKNIVFVAGGLGTAPVYPQVKWLNKNGIYSDVIIGAKTADLLIMEDEIRSVANNVYITTDDGSYGQKGLVTDILKNLIEKDGKKYDLCIAIGPMIMMKFVALTTKLYNLNTVVSMNPIMVDGTGMCGCCRLIVDNKVKFACVDGPEFDAHLVDFDAAIKRQLIYKSEEGRALLKLEEGNTHSGGCAADRR